MEESAGEGRKKAICVILAYNCGNVLEHTYERIPAGSVDRIVLIDDDSKDNTLAEAKRLGIEYYTHKNLGYGGNVKYSLRKCIELGADYMVELHGDGQYDPTAIPMALAKAREGYDIIVGSRFTDLKQPLEDGMSYARYFANIGLSFIARVVLGLPLSEFHSGFRIYTKHLAETVLLDSASDGYRFGFDIIAQAHFHKLPIGEAPIRCDYKEAHTSISIPNSIIYAFQMIGVALLYRLARLGVKIRMFGNRSVSR